MLKHNFIRILAIFTCAGIISISDTQLAKADDSDMEKFPVVKTDYQFKQSQTPEILAEYGSAVFYASGNSAYTTQGNILASQGNKITTFKFNPAGNNFVIISEGKKSPELRIYSNQQEVEVLAKLNNKTFGIPACATYSPDARRFILANNDGKIFTLTSTKFSPIDTMQISFAPTIIKMSSNGYYLAASDGHHVEVFNFDEKKGRQSWLFDSNVNDFAFNADVSDFAIATDDGMINIYDTRNFLVKNELKELGEALSISFNSSGKYMAVVVDENHIKILNLLDPSDMFEINVEEGCVNNLSICEDAFNNNLLFFPSFKSINARRLWQLSPYYGKLIKQQTDDKMNEWLKRMENESFDDYNIRVSDESRKRQRKLFEAEIASSFADNLISMSSISLGKYDRNSNVLQMDFDNMPSIFLPVPEGDVVSFQDIKDLEFRNTKYGVMNNDKFELIYVDVFNRKNGKTYIYDNLRRLTLNYMESDDQIVSIDVIMQQQREEVLLENLRRKVVEEAKQQNIISDHTHISVNSQVVPTYDANGKKILNYNVKFVYEVEPEFIAVEDFPNGKYRYNLSGAASSMLRILKEALEGDLAQYVKPGKKMLIKISGSADASPIHRAIKYDGVYGEFEEEPIFQNGKLSTISLAKSTGIPSNEALAFARGTGVHYFLENEVKGISATNKDYQYYINVAEGTGGQFRRITTEISFIDAFDE